MNPQSKAPLMERDVSGRGEPLCLRIGEIPIRHEDSIELVRTFEKPVLLLAGEGSAPHHHDIVDVLAEELPNAGVVTFPSGHAPHIVSMQPFMEQFTNFLS